MRYDLANNLTGEQRVSRDPDADLPLAPVFNNRLEYWHTDLNSAPLEVTDAEGNLRWSGNYDTFGKLQGQMVAGAERRKGALIDQLLRYAGQYQDNESGLHYNLFRYYEPEVGRFTTQDPIGLRGGLNLYQYAPNPYGWVDPLGLTSKVYEDAPYHGKIDNAVKSRAPTNGLVALDNSVLENGMLCILINEIH